MDSPSAPSSPAETACRNCDAPLSGPFCSQCGQKVVHLDVSLHAFLHEATHEFLHLDGKIVRTLKLLLLAPGTLTNDFIAGRRARHIGPIRLYLTCSVLFFTVATFVDAYGSLVKRAPVSGAAAAHEEAPRPEGAGFSERLRSMKAARARLSREQRWAQLSAALPKAMFVAMPVCALLVWGIYRPRVPFYVPHLYFAIHVHAAVFLILAAARLVNLIARSIGVPIGFTIAVAFLSVVAMFFSPILALQRVYGGHRAGNFMRGFVLMLGYIAVLMYVVAFIASVPSIARAW